MINKHEESVTYQIPSSVDKKTMESWLTTTLILGLYGLLKEFRPSEPFLTEYLVEEKWANITLGQVELTMSVD